MSKENAVKRKFVEWALGNGITQLAIDTRETEGLTLPEHLLGGETRLNYSFNFQGAFPYLEEQGIACKLSFNGVPQDTFVPWENVTGVLFYLSEAKLDRRFMNFCDVDALQNLSNAMYLAEATDGERPRMEVENPNEAVQKPAKKRHIYLMSENKDIKASTSRAELRLIYEGDKDE